MPKCNTYENLCLSGRWKVWIKEHTQERHVFRRDWTTCSRHFRLNNQHNQSRGWGGWGLHDHLMSTKMFITVMNKTYVWV